MKIQSILALLCWLTIKGSQLGGNKHHQQRSKYWRNNTRHISLLTCVITWVLEGMHIYNHPLSTYRTYNFSYFTQIQRQIEDTFSKLTNALCRYLPTQTRECKVLHENPIKHQVIYTQHYDYLDRDKSTRNLFHP